MLEASRIPTVASPGWHYAQGDFEVTSQLPYKAVRMVGWAFRRRGKKMGRPSMAQEQFSHTEYCQGVWECPACSLKIRPRTAHDAPEGGRPSSAEQCKNCSAHGETVALVHVKCGASVHYSREKNVTTIKVKHSGTHSHARPHRKVPTSGEWDQLRLMNRTSAGEVSRLAPDMESALVNRDSNKKRLAKLADEGAVLTRAAPLLSFFAEIDKEPSLRLNSLTTSNGDTVRWVSICADWQRDVASERPFSISFDDTHSVVQGGADLLASAMIYNETVGKHIVIYNALHCGKDTETFARIFMEIFQLHGAPGDHFLGMATDWNDAQILGWVTACLRTSGELTESEVFRWRMLQHSRPSLMEAAMQSLDRVRGCWFHFKQCLAFANEGIEALFDRLPHLAEREDVSVDRFAAASDDAWAAYLDTAKDKHSAATSEAYWREEWGGIRWRLLFDIGVDSVRSRIPNTTNSVESRHRVYKRTHGLENMPYHLVVTKLVELNNGLEREIRGSKMGANFGEKPAARAKQRSKKRSKKPRQSTGESKGKSRGAKRKPSTKVKRQVKSTSKKEAGNSAVPNLLPHLPTSSSALSGEHSVYYHLLAHVANSDCSLQGNRALQESVDLALGAWRRHSSAKNARMQLSSSAAAFTHAVLQFAEINDAFHGEELLVLAQGGHDLAWLSLFARCMCLMLHDASSEDVDSSSGLLSLLELDWNDLHDPTLRHNGIEAPFLDAIGQSSLTDLFVVKLSGGDLQRQTATDLWHLNIPSIVDSSSGTHKFQGCIQWNGKAYKPLILLTRTRQEKEGQRDEEKRGDVLFSCQFSTQNKSGTLLAEGPFSHLEGTKGVARYLLPRPKQSSGYKMILLFYSRLPNLEKGVLHVPSPSIPDRLLEESDSEAGYSDVPTTADNSTQAAPILLASQSPQCLSDDAVILPGLDDKSLLHQSRLNYVSQRWSIHADAQDPGGDPDEAAQLMDEFVDYLAGVLSDGSPGSAVQAEVVDLLSSFSDDGTDPSDDGTDLSTGPEGDDDDYFKTLTARACIKCFSQQNVNSALFAPKCYCEVNLEVFLKHLVEGHKDDHKNVLKTSKILMLTPLDLSYCTSSSVAAWKASARVSLKLTGLKEPDWLAASVVVPLSLSADGKPSWRQKGLLPAIHWVLAVADIKTGAVFVFDSMDSFPVSAPEILKTVQEFSTCVTTTLGFAPSHMNSIKVYHMAKQTDGHSCGPFVCCLLHNIAATGRADPSSVMGNVTQESAHEMRLRMQQHCGLLPIA